jgi:hypothetical protein
MVAGNVLWEELDAKYFLVQYLMTSTIIKSICIWNDRNTHCLGKFHSLERNINLEMVDEIRCFWSVQS